MYEYFVQHITNINEMELQAIIEKICSKNLKWELITVTANNNFIFKRPKP